MLKLSLGGGPYTRHFLLVQRRVVVVIQGSKVEAPASGSRNT
jgi:hypothetical protein